MRLLIPLFVFGLFFASQNALAQSHLDLKVVVDLDRNLLEVQGTSTIDFRLPKNAKSKSTETGFAYDFPLPDITEGQGRSHYSYRGNRSFYLPFGWYPETEGLLTFNLDITSPWPVVAPGRIENEVQTGQSYSAKFAMGVPTEGIPLFGGQYKIETQMLGDLLIRTYFFEGMEDLSEGYLQRSAQYIERFQKEIAPFPFAAFHVIAADLPVGLGFAGMTYIGERVLKLPFIKETSLGHEILHNYWGNGVFPDYLKGNWAEGLTTYQADYMTAEMKSEDLAKDMRLSWLRDYAALPKEKDKPVTSFISKHDGASEVIGYHKVAFIFHMLRQKIGDDAFFKGLRTFWNNYAFKIAGWEAVKTSFETASGQDLSDFFKQWVHQNGAPKFKTMQSTAKFEKGRGWFIKTTLTQNSPAFDTFIPVAVGMSEAVYDKQIRIKGKIGQSEILVPEKPKAISLDPDFNLFRHLGTDEAPPIMRDVMLAPSVHVNFLSEDLKETAHALVNTLIEGDQKTASDKSDATIIIATQQDMLRYLKSNAIPVKNFPNGLDATSKIWVVKNNKKPALFIMVRDEQALKDLLRPLRHYGRRGTLAFNGSQAAYKASAEARPLTVPIQ